MGKNNDVNVLSDQLTNQQLFQEQFRTSQTLCFQSNCHSFANLINLQLEHVLCSTNSIASAGPYLKNLRLLRTFKER